MSEKPAYPKYQKKEKKQYLNQDARDLLESSTLSPSKRTSLHVLIDMELLFVNKSINREALEAKVEKRGLLAEDIIQDWIELDFARGDKKLYFRTIQCTKCKRFISRINQQRVCFTCGIEYCRECEHDRAIPINSTNLFVQKAIDSTWVCQSCFQKIQEYSAELPDILIKEDYPITIFHSISPFFLHYSRVVKNPGTYIDKHHYCTVHFFNGEQIPFFRVASKSQINVRSEIEIDSDLSTEILLGIFEEYYGFPDIMLWAMEQANDTDRGFKIFIRKPSDQDLKYLLGKEIPVCQNCDIMILRKNMERPDCIYCGSKLHVVYRQNRYFKVALAPKPKDYKGYLGLNWIFIRLGEVILQCRLDIGDLLTIFQTYMSNQQIGPFQMSFKEGKVIFKRLKPPSPSQEILFPEDKILD